jgi:hypothetical protein
MEEGEQVEVDFHPHYHHPKKNKLEWEHKMAQLLKMARSLKVAQTSN